MFIVLLKFSDNRARASEFMKGHNEWIEKGMTDGVFLLVGSLQPGLGGAVVADQVSLQDLQARVAQDPFVIEKVVTTEILQIAASKAVERLKFLVQ